MKVAEELARTHVQSTLTLDQSQMEPYFEARIHAHEKKYFLMTYNMPIFGVVYTKLYFSRQTVIIAN